MINQTEKNNKLDIMAMMECGLFVALIAAGAFIKIPMPAIPFTLQVMFTNLAGILLGKKYGSISVIVYILIGLTGIPIFTGGGGLGYIFHPTFGYMIGMVFGTYAAGQIREKRADFKYRTTFIAGITNIAIMYAIGLPYFIGVMKIYMDSDMAIGALVMSGFVLTLPGDIIKCAISSILAKRVGNIVKV